MKKVERDEGAKEENDGESEEGDGSEGGKRRAKGAGTVERNEGSFGTARRKRAGRGVEEDMEEEVSSTIKEAGKESEADEEKDDNTFGGGEEDKKAKSGRLPKGGVITAQETVGLDNVSMRGRRRRVIKDEEEDLDAVLAGIPSTKEGNDNNINGKKREEEEEEGEKMRTKRLPRGERIAESNQQSLGALSFKDRRRRRTEDEVRGV